MAPGDPGTRWSRRDLADQAAVTAAEEAEALDLRRQQERVRDWLVNAESAPEWDDVAFATQNWLRLTPEELGQVADEVIDVLVRWGRPRRARRRRSTASRSSCSRAASRASHERR